MSKIHQLEESVFAIPTVELWNLLAYKKTGLIKANHHVLEKLFQHGLFRSRSELEEDPAFKQIIPYAMITNNESLYLFKRLPGQTETRLHQKFSIGVGGHMGPGRIKELNEQYIIDELKRELFEEVSLTDTCILEKIIFAGFINDDSIEVGRVHIGLLFNIEVSNKGIAINETDKMTASWIEKADIPNYYARLETWSRIAIDHFFEGDGDDNIDPAS